MSSKKAKTLQLNAGNADEQTGTLVFNFKPNNVYSPSQTRPEQKNTTHKIAMSNFEGKTYLVTGGASGLGGPSQVCIGVRR